jgi:hypothetical protein
MLWKHDALYAGTGTRSRLSGNVASDLEDRAAQDQLEEAQPLVERLSG